MMASTDPTHSSDSTARVRGPEAVAPDRDPAAVADRDPAAVADRALERQGRRLGYSASRFFLVGVALAIPGIVLLLIDHGWSIGVGIAVLLIASIPLVVGAGLLVSSAVSRWAARRKLFA